MLGSGKDLHTAAQHTQTWRDKTCSCACLAYRKQESNIIVVTSISICIAIPRIIAIVIAIIMLTTNVVLECTEMTSDCWYGR